VCKGVGECECTSGCAEDTLVGLTSVVLWRSAQQYHNNNYIIITSLQKPLRGFCSLSLQRKDLTSIVFKVRFNVSCI
jgi:hypothetical protein